MFCFWYAFGSYFLEVSHGNNFYAYSVLTRQTTWQSTFRYIIIMAGAVVIVAYLIYFCATNTQTNIAIY